MQIPTSTASSTGHYVMRVYTMSTSKNKVEYLMIKFEGQLLILTAGDAGPGLQWSLGRVMVVIFQYSL